MKTIIASLIAKNQTELNSRFNFLKNNIKYFQLDVMDGKFVKNKSLWFDFKLVKKPGFFYEAHLMVKNPEDWIKKYGKKVNTIIFHYESTKNPEAVIRLIKSKKKKVGIAINPNTPTEKIKSFLPNIDLVLVMTVVPGKYGAKFLPKTLTKVKQLRKLKPKLTIEVDGGIDNKTIKKAYGAGANRFISGSYLQKSKDLGKALSSLRA